MTNEEQKLREIVERWMGKKHPITMQSYVSDLTALISEHYYPKEFVEWMLKCGTYSDVPYKTFTLKWNVNIEPGTWQYFTTDELFNYWEENERC